MPYFSTVSRSACGQARTVALDDSDPGHAVAVRALDDQQQPVRPARGIARLQCSGCASRRRGPARGRPVAWAQAAKRTPARPKMRWIRFMFRGPARRRVSRGGSSNAPQSRTLATTCPRSQSMPSSRQLPADQCMRMDMPGSWKGSSSMRSPSRRLAHSRARWPGTTAVSEVPASSSDSMKKLDEVTTGSSARSRKRSATIWWAERGTSATA